MGERVVRVDGHMSHRACWESGSKWVTHNRVRMRREECREKNPRDGNSQCKSSEFILPGVENIHQSELIQDACFAGFMRMEVQSLTPQRLCKKSFLFWKAG